MKLLFISLAFLLLFVSQCAKAKAAECPKNVQRISEGTAAPCSGWIVKDEQMQTFARTSDQLELEKQTTKLNEQLLRLNQDEIEFYKKRATVATDKLENADKARFWSNLGYFMLGVALTGVAAKTAIEVSK